jgi:hypothetical protein
MHEELLAIQGAALQGKSNRTLVARLKNMPALPSKGVEPDCKGPYSQRIPSSKIGSGVSTAKW